MRVKSLLHDVESYLRAEVELNQRPQVSAPLTQKLESDRSRLLREVELEAREEVLPPFQRILVAIDASPQSTAAIELARKFARTGAVTFALIHVMDDPAGMYEGFAAPVSIAGEKCLRREKANLLLKSAAERLFPRNLPMDQAEPQIEMIVREGPVVTKLIEAAKEFEADLIIMGTHGRRGISHLLMGSTAEGVIRQAPCPVMSVTTAA